MYKHFDDIFSGDATVEEAFAETMGPFRFFMAARIAPDTFAALAELRPDLHREGHVDGRSDVGDALPLLAITLQRVKKSTLNKEPK